MPTKGVSRIQAPPPETVSTPIISSSLVAFDGPDLTARLGRIEDGLASLAARPGAPEAILSSPKHPFAGAVAYVLGALTTAGVALVDGGQRHALVTFEYICAGAIGALVGLVFAGVRR